MTLVWKLWEGAKVIGNAGALTRKLPLFDRTLLTIAFDFPVLVTVKNWALLVSPTG